MMKASNRRLSRRRLQVLMEALDSRVLLTGTPGDLDTTFGSAGFNIQQPPGTAQAIAQDSNGGYIVAGSVPNGGNTEFALMRYNADGTLDTTFGTNGIDAFTSGGITHGELRAVGFDGSKIVAVGEDTDHNNAVIARFDAKGVLDPTFGSGGVSVITNSNLIVQSMLVLPTHAVVLGGTNLSQGLVIKVGATGALDSTFGTGGGRVLFPTGSDTSGVAALALTSSSEIEAIGADTVSAESHPMLALMTTAGAMDLSFGPNGTGIIVDGSNVGSVAAGLVEPNGSVVVGGENGSIPFIRRYLADGTQDSSFNQEFRDSNAPINSLALQSDGKIVAGIKSVFEVLRFNPDGSYDSGFGNGGVASENLPSSTPTQLIVDSSGKIVVAGSVPGASQPQVTLLRLESTDTIAPLAVSANQNPPTTGASWYDFTIDYSDNVAVSAASIPTIVQITGPHNFAATARAVDLPTADSNSILVTYRAPAPNGQWDVRAIGNYVISLGSFSDTSGNSSAPQTIDGVNYGFTGTFDPSFGLPGRLELGVSDQDFINDTAVQSDGKILAVGSTIDPFVPGGSMLVERFNYDGTLDTSFAGSGRVVIDASSSGFGAEGRTIGILPDGDIVAGGTVDGAFSLYEFAPDGSMVAGPEQVPFDSSNPHLTSMTIDSSGRVLLAGINFDNNATLIARFDGNALDSTFGSGNGFEQLTDPSLTGGANSIVTAPDGSIYIAGSFGVAKLDDAGNVDSSFGSSGVLTPATGLTIDSIVATNVSGGIDLNFTGSFFNNDLQSGAAGVISVPNSGSASFQSTTVLDLLLASRNVILADGSMLVAGQSPGGDMAVQVINNGVKQPMTIIPLSDNTSDPINPTNSAANALALTPDGKIVLAGYVQGELGTLQAFARLNPDLTLDQGFGQPGRVLTIPQQTIQAATTSAVQSDGKILVAGMQSGDNLPVVYRFNSNGSLDSSFGNGGSVENFGTDGSTTIRAILPQADGTILVALSNEVFSSTPDVLLVRLTSSGTFDGTFGSGVNQVDIGGSDFASSMIALPNGDILVGGTTRDVNFTGNFFLVAFAPDGSIDASFGNNGIVTTDFDGADDSLASVQLSPDGQSLYAFGTSNGEFALARYSLSGVLDTNFGLHTYTSPDVNNLHLTGAAFDSQGRFLLSGYSQQVFSVVGAPVVSGGTGVLMRILVDGSQDDTFNSGALLLPSSTVDAITTDSSGNIYIALDNMQVQRFDASGNPDFSFGIGSLGYPPFDSLLGETSQTIGLAFDGSDLVQVGQLNITQSNSLPVVAKYLAQVSLPDLMVSTATAPGNVLQNQSFDISGTVANVGNDVAGASTLSFFIMANGSTQSTLLGEQAIGVMEANGSSDFSQPITLGSTFAPGQYTISVIADSADAVDESNEFNNVFTFPITLAAPFVDVAVNSLSAPTSATDGQSVNLSVGVANNGNIDSDPVTVNIYYGTSSTFQGNELLLASAPIGSLPANSTANLPLSVNIPDDSTGGTHFLFAVATTATDSDTTNNTQSSAVIITAEPNLAPDSITAPQSATAGTSIPAQLIISNTGGADSPSFDYTYWLTMFPTKGTHVGDILLGTPTHAGLSAGASATINDTFAIPANLTPGTYYLLTLADPANQITEVHEDDNFGLSEAISISAAPADLVVQSVSASTSITAGNPISLNFNIANTGFTDTPPFLVGVVLSPDGTFGNADDISLGNIAGSYSVSANSTLPFTNATVNVPANIPAGNYNVFVVADSVNSVSESNESNNFASASQTLAVTAAPADLTFPAILNYPTNANAGGTIDVGFQLKNQGFSDAPSPQVEFFLSSDGTLTNAVDLGTFNYSTVAAGSTTTTIDQTLTIPQTTAGGNYKIIAEIDPNHKLTESDTSNNITAGAATAIAPGLPDLTFGTLVASTSVNAGGNALVSGSIANNGFSAASPVAVQYFLSTDTTLDASDVSLGTFTYGTINAQSAFPLSQNLTIPSATKSANYFIIAKVNPTGSIVESDTTNNIGIAGPMAVQLAPADLVMNSVTPASSATLGGTINVDFSYSNLGGTDVPAFNIGMFLSTDQTLSAEDTLLIAQPAAANAGQTVTPPTKTYVLPSNLTPGTYFLIAKADYDSQITESDETNNIAISGPVSLNGLPNLVITSIDSPTGVSAGDSDIFTVHISNTGSTTAPATNARLVISSDTVIGNADDIVTGTAATPSLAPGATADIPFAVSIPSTATPGQYFVIGQADSDGTLNETTKTDNVVSNSLLISPPPRPNLTFSNVTADSSVYPGNSIGVTVTIANNGTADSTATTFNVVASRDEVLGNADDITLGSFSVPAITAGSIVTSSKSFAIPANQPIGNMTIFEVLDPANTVTESNEADNTHENALTILSPTPSITALSYDPSIIAGQSINITPTVNNPSPLGSTSFTIKYFLSSDQTLSADDVQLGTAGYISAPSGSSSLSAFAATIPSTITPGTYFVIANTTLDNSTQTLAGPTLFTGSATSIVQGSANVSIDSLNVDTLTVNQGGTFTLRPVLKNTGNIDSTGNTLETDLSLDSIFGNADDITIDTASVPVIAAGSSIDLGKTSITLPDSIAAGNYFVISQLDNGNTFTSDGALFSVTARPEPTQVQVGGLDPNFGNGGVAQSTFDTLQFKTVDIKETAASQLVVGGYTTNTGDFFLTRFNSDGSLDTSFGNAGVTLLDLHGNFDIATALAFGPDGSIYLAGSTSAASADSDFAVAHFSSNGIVDSSFGTGGFTIIDINNHSADFASSIKLTPDGHTIYLGGTSGSDMAVASLTSSGALNTAFNSTGIRTIDFNGKADAANTMILQNDGKIILVGSAENSSASITSIAVARVNPNGSLDNTFDRDGLATFSLRSNDDEAFAAALQTDGKIVVGGYSATGSLDDGSLNTDFAVARITTKGKLDTSFGKKGSAITVIPNEPLSGITKLVVTSAGKIVAAGKTAASLQDALNNNLGVAVVRYDSKGNLDPTFNNTGILLLFQPTPSGQAAPGDSLVNQFNDFVSSATGLVDLDEGGGILALASGEDADTNSTTVSIASVVADGVDLTAQLATSGVPSSVLGGAKGTAVVTIRDTGSLPVAGKAAVTFYLSKDNTRSDDDVPFLTTSVSLKLKPNQSKAFKIKFTFPTNLDDGNYFLIADINSSGAVNELTQANDDAATNSSMNIAKPFVDLVATSVTPTGTDFSTGGAVSLLIKNLGNVLAKGPSTVTLFASADQTIGDDTQLFVLNKNVNIKPGATLALKMKFTLPAGAVPPGTDFLLATLGFTGTPADSDASNNSVFSSTTVTFQ